MLSIIIPTLNEEALLPGLLKSIQIQEYKDYEVIVSDAGSSDKTINIARKYGCRIVPGGSPAVARNNGAKIARGEYLLFLDADVILPEHFLRNILLEFIERKLDVSTCFFKPLTNKRIDFILHNIANNYILLTRKVHPHAPGFCILSRRSIHQRINGFNEELKMGEDHDYVRRASKFGRFGILSSGKILVSIRRLDRDGRFNLSLKYLAVEIHRIIIGEIRSEIFNYKFGYGTKSG